MSIPISSYAVSAATPPVEDDPYSHLDQSPSIIDKPVISKNIVFTVTPEGISARYDVLVSKDHPLFKAVQIDEGGEKVERLIQNVLGTIEMRGSVGSGDFRTPISKTFEFYPPEVSLAENAPNGRFQVVSKTVESPNTTYRIALHAPNLTANLKIEKREVTVNTTDVQVRSGSVDLLPVSKSPEQTRYELPGSPSHLSFFYFSVHIPEWAAARIPVPPDQGSTLLLADVISRNVETPVLGWIIYGLLDSLPFLLFLAWASKHNWQADKPGIERSALVIRLYLVFHFGYFFFLAVDELIRKWGNPAHWALRQFLQQANLEIYLGSLNSSYLLTSMLLMVIYVWPTIIARAERGAPVDSKYSMLRKHGGKAILAVTFIPLVLAAGVLVFRTTTFDIKTLSTINFFILCYSVILAALYATCIWLAFEVSRTRRVQTALLSFLILISLVVIDHSYSDRRYWRPIASFLLTAVFILASTILAFTFGKLIYRAFTGHSLTQDRKGWRLWQKLSLVGIFIVVAISTRSWTIPMQWWPLWSLGWQMKNLFLLALAGILVLFLKHVSETRDWLQLPESARRAGILLALTLFYSSTTRWYYIPIPFLVGYLLLSRWLLPGRDFDKTVYSEIRDRFKAIVSRIIDFNDAEKSLKQLKKELLTKLSKGDLDHQEYVKKLEAHSDAVEKMRENLQVHGLFAKEIVLGFGPPGGRAWENGMRAGLYSLAAASPWIIIYLRNTIKAPISAESYLILDSLISLVFIVASWVSYGFILGYFYPYIRGNNGVQKGLSLFVTILAPTLVWTALTAPLDRDNWLSLGFWTLQIFLHTIILGFIAGDFEILRRSGFRLNHLMEIHRLGYLSAWASSLVLAFGAAVAGLISSGAADIVATVLKYMGVIPKEVQLPTK